MSNLTQNDVLETGIEVNDAPDDAQRWSPFNSVNVSTWVNLNYYNVLGQWTKIKEYIQDNFKAWKVGLVVLSIIQLLVLFYVATVVGRVKHLAGKKLRAALNVDYSQIINLHVVYALYQRR